MEWEPNWNDDATCGDGDHIFNWTWVDGETRMHPPAGTRCKCGKTVWEDEP